MKRCVRFAAVQCLLASLLALCFATIPNQGNATVSDPSLPSTVNQRLNQTDVEACPPVQPPGSNNSANTSAGDEEIVYDYAILIDISGSMIGLPDGNSPVIFPDVKNSAKQFVDSLARGSNILIIPFGDMINPDNIRLFTLDKRDARGNAKAYIDGLTADNGQTHITESVATALDQLANLKQDDGRVHVQTILLYTDGVGNGPGDTNDQRQPSIDELLSRLDAYRSDQPYLFVKYVALGVSVPNRDALEAQGVQVVEEASGQVSPVREVRLSIPRSNLGSISPDVPVENQLCILSGDASNPIPLQLSLNFDELPLDLRMELSPSSAEITADGVPLTWTLRRDSASVTSGTYQIDLNITTSDPTIILVPSSLPVSLTALPPATATPSPTNTPAPTYTPTVTPSPTIAPTETPSPTVTPSPTFTPIPPSPTPTMAIAFDITVPLDMGKSKVSVDSNPNDTVEWETTIPGEFFNSTSADVRFEPETSSGDPTANGLAGTFETESASGLTSMTVDSSTSSVKLRVTLPASSVVPLGNGTYALKGNLVVSPHPAGTALLPAGAERLEDGSYRFPVQMQANVFTPTDWGRIALLALIGLLLLAALIVLWLIRPGLPPHAAVVRGGQRHELTKRRSTIGSTADDVSVGIGETAGTISGGWRRRAYFIAARDGILHGREKLTQGQKVRLTDGDQITADRVRFGFTTEPPTTR